jgi:hypothetical protein
MTIYPVVAQKHIVSVSSGAPSALLLMLINLADTYGKNNVVGLFADTNAEHPDNYRFLYDLQRAGYDIEFVTTGKSPNQLQLEQNTIFTNFLAPCTRQLKLEPIREFVQTMQRCGYLCHMHVGFTVEDAKPTSDKPNGRITDTKASWLSNGVIPHFHLVDEQYNRQQVMSELKQRGFIVPMSYALGFPNANCLAEGGCVKGGKGYMLKILTHFPEYYAKREETERIIRIRQYKKQRENGVRVADIKLYSYLKSQVHAGGRVTLKQFRLEHEAAQRDDMQLKLFTLDADGDLCGAECGVSNPGIWQQPAA